MNTDLHVGKRNCPTSSITDPNPTPNQTMGQVQKPTTPTSKHPNIEKPPSPAAQNQWNVLRLGNNSTPENSGGFPTPQLGQLTWQNVSQVLKEKWPQEEGAKAWVCTYHVIHESNAQSTVAKLKDAIAKIIGESNAETLVISTLTATVELIERLPPPWHFLISSIPPEAIEWLVRLQPLPIYAFTLENFSFPDSKTTNKEIAEIVKETICFNPKVLQYIHNNIPVADSEAAIQTIESIRVASLTLAHSKTAKKTVWNVYFESPLNFTLKQYFDWTSILCSFLYISEDYGYGTAHQDA
ncbi:hypothetical protein EDD22DRAFT_848231 [Suillus occidentalis]|nr:hypothetical protein EDD22DRAFT_848231 [Suillus occidentalis]